MYRVRAQQQSVYAAAFAGALLLAGSIPARAQDDPLYNIDWSVGLRGSYAASSLTGGDAEAIVAPQLSLTRNGARDQTSVTSAGQFAVDSAGKVRVDSLRLGASSSYALDEASKLDGSIDLSLNQLKATDSSLPTDTATGPLEFTGTAQGSATRKFGRFDVTGRLTGERFIEGPTTLVNSTVDDNTDQNYWQGLAGLRVGYELTPLVSVFVDGSESYQAFDAPSPTLAKFLSGKTAELRGGLSYTFNSTLTAEVSAGRAWLDYDDPSIADAPGWVYDASVTFAPDETLSLTGSFNTTLGPSSDYPGDTDLAYALNGAASYRVNPWVSLRGSATYDRTQTLGNGALASGYSAGAGIDVASSRHVTWSADYLFEHDEPASTAKSDTHTVTVGVTIKR